MDVDPATGRTALTRDETEPWVQVALSARVMQGTLRQIPAPAPGSLLDVARAFFPDEAAADWSRSFLAAALEHLVMWADYATPLKFHPEAAVEFALRPVQTLARAALESASQAVWVLSTADVREASRRHVYLVLADWEEQGKAAKRDAVAGGQSRRGDLWMETGAVFAGPDGRPLSPERLTRGLPSLVARYNAELRVSRLDDKALANLADELRPRRARELAQHKTPALSSVLRGAVADADYAAALRTDPTLTGTPLPVVKFHSLRHLQASLMLAAGVPLAVVSKRLGHSSTSITSDTYSHMLEGVGAQAAAAAAALIPRRSSADSTQIPRNAADANVTGAERHVRMDL